jgi:hypothetical protein
MTISVVETVAVAGLTLTFANAQPNDLALMSLKYFWSGSTTPVIELAPFISLASTASQELAWKELFAGETSFTFTALHTTGQQIVAVLLRNDSGPNVVPALDEAASSHTTVVTDVANDCVVVCSGSETGAGSFTGDSYALAVSSANAAFWTRVPFQVPLGTSLRVEATGDTNFLSLMAWRPWRSYVPVPPVAAGGWSGWIID